jgi:hypothetical protein
MLLFCSSVCAWILGAHDNLWVRGRGLKYPRNISVAFFRSCDLHHNKFLYNKTNQMHQFPNTPEWDSTCFGQFPCPSSGAYSLYTRQWYMPYRFEQDQDGTAVTSWSCSKAVYKPVWHIPLPSVQWISSWWWAGELSETRRLSFRSKFGKLMHLVGFIIKKYRWRFFPIGHYVRYEFLLHCLLDTWPH